MIKQYIKQAWQMLKENRLISSISITGTAISITMIMMVVLVLQVQVANYYPEEHRDRMLYVENGTLVRMKENTGNWNSGNMSIEAVKECFYTLQSPEFVTAYALLQFTVSLPDKRNYMAHRVKLTDTGFWKVFSFHFDFSIACRRSSMMSSGFSIPTERRRRRSVIPSFSFCSAGTSG